MIIWECKDWQVFLSNVEHRTGIRFRFDKNVDESVRKAILNFSHWMKQSYDFPLRVAVYVKSNKRIKACDGELVCGTFFRPYSYGVEPYIRIATGDYPVLEKKRGRDNALSSVLVSLAHELTHYYQYINKIEQSLHGEEVQAGRTASVILDRYAQTRDHPFQDGDDHVSVYPIGGTMEEWYLSGPYSIWSLAVKSVCKKWDVN